METSMIDYENVIYQLIGRAVTDVNEYSHDLKPEIIKKYADSDDYLNDLYQDLQTKYECISSLKHGGIREFDLLNEKWSG
ncbi:MAG: hypothetical protein HRT68_14760, partial [Flavobacteriaceae bacterium]|nr:hypothetical protein [Flavobacteriaceae bacterium]